MTIEPYKSQSFVSDRVRLIPISEHHSSFIYELLNSKGWKTNIGNRNINTLEDAIAYVKKIHNMPETIYWVVVTLEKNIPIGIISLMKRVNFDFYDIGYAFLDDFMGYGYALEASETLIRFLKLESEILTIIAITLIHNLKSLQLLEKLNFILEKEYTENEEQLYLYKLDLKNK